MPDQQSNQMWMMVSDIKFSPDGKLFAAAVNNLGADPITGHLRLWETATGKLLHIFAGHTDYVLRLAFSPFGEHVASGSYDKSVRLWNIHTGQHVATYQAHEGRVYSIAFSPDGRFIASGHDYTTIRLWNVGVGDERCLKTPILKHESDTSPIDSIAFSPDGQVLATSNDNIVRFWNVISGKVSSYLKLPGIGHVQSVDFSPNGKILAFGFAGSIQLANPFTLGTSFKKSESTIYSVKFSPDGSTISSGHGDRTARVWDVATGTVKKTFMGHENAVYSAAYSPDGKLLATASHDQTARIWDIESGKEVMRISARS